MQRIGKLFGVALVAAALAGCATFQVPTRTSPENGAIFGYFDIPQAYGYLQSMSIVSRHSGIHLGIPNDVPYIIHGGAFFAYNAKPDQYYILALYTMGGGVFHNKQEQLTLMQGKIGDKAYNERLMKKMALTLKPGKLLYVGAKKIYVGRHQGLFTNGSFSIGPEKKPTEKQVLEQLLPALKGTPWQQPAETLLASLK